jgi:hypothetical protein
MEKQKTTKNVDENDEINLLTDEKIDEIDFFYEIRDNYYQDICKK